MLKLILYTPSEIPQSSYVYAGFFELEKNNYLKCVIKFKRINKLGSIIISESKIMKTKIHHPKTSFYKLIKGNVNIKFAIDTYDDATKFSLYALEKSEYVFKRNFNKKIIEKLPEKYKKKIQPLGLTFPCKSQYRHSTIKLLIGTILNIFHMYFKLDRLLIFRFKLIFMDIKKNFLFDLNNRLISSFNLKNRNFEKTKSQILFQTRCFEDDSNIDTKILHKNRDNLISELKKNIGNKFKGGFIKSSHSKKYYKNNISNVNSNSESYFKEVQLSQIVIYSNGLLGSPAWKMAEYLSQGKAIISEKLTTELPTKIEHRKHLIFFSDIKDCGIVAKKLIKNKKLILELSKNAREYYDNYVDPTKNMQRIIEEMLNNYKK
jgi:hypothetical protein